MAKYALVIGIDYDGELPGCLTDANDMEIALKKQGYNVTKLLGRQCTARRLIQSFAYMCYYSYLGRYRELFIHYSGHGTRVRDRNGDELDGYDEAMVSCDKYAISDDTFYAISSVVTQVDQCKNFDGLLSFRNQYGSSVQVAPRYKQIFY